MCTTYQFQLFGRLPLHAQAISYSAVLSGEPCLIADQTGSGKTLAYLAPLVQRLRYAPAAEFALRFGSEP